MIHKDKIDLKAELTLFLSLLIIVLFPSMLFFIIVLALSGISIPICIITFIIIWSVPIFLLSKIYYLKGKDQPEDRNQLIKFGEKVIATNDLYLRKIYIFGLNVVLFIIFSLFLQAFVYTIFKEIALILGSIIAFLFFLLILFIDYIIFNELKFSIYSKKLGMKQTEINLLFFDIKLNASKDKEKFLKKFQIRKYCTIKKGICRRKVIFYGAKSCFFAFPFQEPFLTVMNKLKFGLEKIGFKVKVLTDESFDDVLICKLCREILSSNFIICEVSLLNRNVMFEYGYAKGLGKAGWLILDRSSKNSLIKKGIFSDVIQLRYSYIDEVVAEVKNTPILSGDSQVISNPNITGDCKNCHISPDEKRCLILTPDIFVSKNNKSSLNTKPISNRIRGKLSNLGFKVNSIREITEGHILCSYCKQIKGSDYIIAIYVSDDVIDNELINSGLAFLIGLALALGKRILILQKKPIHHPMIDLKGSVRDFKDLKDLDSKVTNFIAR